MITTPSQHAALIASALADVIRSGARQHPDRGALERIAELLDTVVIAFVDAEPYADAVLALQDAEILASRSPGAGLPLGFTAAVLAPVTGQAPELPVPVGAASPQLAEQDARLRARLALVEEWLLGTQHPDMVPAYASMSLTLRTKLAHIAAAVAVGSRA
ncbi:hypothetical protein [Streptomyces lancefieldiae]|uniref:Uncharacterized protein n=1 Tax=Streptomyces lancefieldiae TaxID=3075520 RepID=A0ABU3B3C6_9ACTN|nr:hypothetical protein [Streptomyces sp. DSM 40712]MDT0616352.1 hypothetical protein [Streptomyces sp. DSM 40712]